MKFLGPLRRLFGYAYEKQKRVMILGLSISFFWSFLFIGKPYLTGIAFDAIINDLESVNTIGIGTWAVLFLILSFIVIEYFTVNVLHYLCGIFGARTGEQIRNDIFKTLQQQSYKYYDDNSTGDLVSKATTDTDLFVNFLYYILLAGTLTFGEAFFIIFFLLTINVEFGLVCLFSFPFMWLITRQFEKRYSPLVFESRKQFGQLSKVIQENIEGVKISKTFDSKDKDFQRYDLQSKKYLDLQNHAHKTRAILFPLINLFSGALRTFVLVYGGLLVIDNNGFTIGMLVSSIMLSQYLRVPLNNISGMTTIGGEARAASRRVFEILDSNPEISEVNEAISFNKDNKGEISFKNVSFGYRSEPVLENVNLNIPAGSNIAILGGTGSGKSSLINLIPRYYDSKIGTVMIDSINVKNYKLNSLRKHIGFVDQETFLFSKTIRENIAFGKPDANLEEITEAAKAAQIHDYVMTLPDQYDTPLGERGVNLSGGQRQRLSIARALLADPTIVILDDSLSAVDIKTEHEIQKALDILLKDRTTIMVTQRLSTTSSADKIIIINKGKIVEKGTHSELLSQNGIYSSLFETQIDGIIDLSQIQQKEFAINEF